MPEPGVTNEIGKRWSILKGLAFGSGFMENIEDAYRFLMATYNPGDKVFLFGFSRGAFTSRALAGMLFSVGLLRPGSENLIRYAQSYWLRNHPDRQAGSVDDQERSRRNPNYGPMLCHEFKAAFARPCPVHFLGVWDTVASIGIINLYHTFPYTRHNPEVAHVRHAVSIDEKRSCFRQNLMTPNGVNDTRDIKNVWFAGDHSDVGGGYPPANSGPAKLTFQW